MAQSAVSYALMRYACCSTSRSTALQAPGDCFRKLFCMSLQKRFLIGSTAAAAGVVAAYHKDLTQLHFDTFSALGPFLRLLDAETSHNVGMWTAGHGILPRDRRPDSPSLAISVWGRDFPNPIGTINDIEVSHCQCNQRPCTRIHRVLSASNPASAKLQCEHSNFFNAKLCHAVFRQSLALVKGHRITLTDHRLKSSTLLACAQDWRQDLTRMHMLSMACWGLALVLLKLVCDAQVLPALRIACLCCVSSLLCLANMLTSYIWSQHQMPACISTLLAELTHLDSNVFPYCDKAGPQLASTLSKRHASAFTCFLMSLVWGMSLYSACDHESGNVGLKLQQQLHVQAQMWQLEVAATATAHRTQTIQLLGCTHSAVAG